MQSPRSAQCWHGLTAVVALVALLLQVALVVSGASVLVEAAAPPSTPVRLFRFLTYFTVQSNLLVLLTTAGLALRPDRDGGLWRVVRLDAMVGITVTGVIHWFLLRPLLDLDGWSWVADKLLHLAVPILAALGWLLFGPRARLTRADVVPALVWPVGYMAFTLAHGAVTGFYPYPFVDVDALGYPAVVVNGVAVAVLFLLMAVAARWADARLAGPRTPASGAGDPRTT